MSKKQEKLETVDIADKVFAVIAKLELSETFLGMINEMTETKLKTQYDRLMFSSLQEQIYALNFHIREDVRNMTAELQEAYETLEKMAKEEKVA